MNKCIRNGFLLELGQKNVKMGKMEMKKMKFHGIMVME